LDVPKVVDRERRRGDLGRAAARVVSRIGLEGVTVQAVAAEAGCSAGSIAHYFRNKDELLVQALHAATEALIQLLREPAEPLCTLDALRALARGCLPLDSDRERDWRVRLAFWTRASGPPEEVQLARDHLAEWRVLWEGAICSVQAQGGVRADVDAAEASAGIVALIVGTAAQLLVRPRPRGAQLLDPVESYLRGLGSRLLQ
jgi:AcrR family transcriptional regulator